MMTPLLGGKSANPFFKWSFSSALTLHENALSPDSPAYIQDWLPLCETGNRLVMTLLDTRDEVVMLVSGVFTMEEHV